MDDLGIADWLESAGPAPHETGPLLGGLGDLVAGNDAPPPAQRPASKHAAASGPAIDTGRPASTESRHAAAGSPPAADDTRRAPADPAGAPAESRYTGARSRRTAEESPRKAAESRHPAGEARQAAPESMHAAGEARHTPAESRPAGGRRARGRHSGVVPSADEAQAATGAAAPGTTAASGPVATSRTTAEPGASSRTSDPGVTSRAAAEPGVTTSRAADAAAAPVFGTPFWSAPAPQPDPDDPLGLDSDPARAPAADPSPTRSASKHAAPGRRARNRTSGPVAAPATPLRPEPAAPPRAPEHTQAFAPAPTSTPATPTQDPAPETRLAPRTGGGRRAAGRAAEPATRTASPAFIPGLDDDEDDDRALEPDSRESRETRRAAPGTRRTGGDPPNRATAGALAACLSIAAVIGFAGGAWFGSRPDDGARPSDSTSTGPGTQAPGEPVPEEGVTLAADPVSVPPNGLIALAGTLAPAEAGVQLRLQHRVGDGEWQDYPASRPITLTTRDDGSFSGSVATDAPGPNAFRLINADDGEMVSNEIAVTVTE
ncbi:hypothetical protein [Jiangella anatolica]|uniref:Uncharacterized protein n=1 Tax=Jiangella anatolica TaxID=2670374 RepID=A0A2W2B6E2_9ACTN|nr:hypothetical protein [Jiangella anatolica]PZF80620.1 hypothetical protein C1I92_25120 [Jiangella anatolica]